MCAGRAISKTRCGASSLVSAFLFSALWALRYRPPKDIGVSIYARLQAAHEAVREAQMRKFQDEYERAKAASWADAPLVLAAAALVGEDVQKG